jgi:hypothetical protein
MGTFGGYPIAGQTEHFLVTYADEADADALGRAQAIVSGCESDLQTLESWFQCDYSRSPYGIWVHVFTGVPGGGAQNFGYTDEESAKIFIFATYQPASPPANAIAIRDDFARMLFVAELAEILMDFTGYGWNRSDSGGEGLSRIAAAELHPLSYYTSGAGNGPVVNPWLQAKPRPDFVSASEQTDQNPLSYGCAVLFLNYLTYQLGYDFSRIVPAGGASLADTYGRLIGRPSSNAFNEFSALLEQHLPTGQIPSVLRDNVFPLRTGSARSVGLNLSQRTLSSVLQPGVLEARLKAGPECPAKLYTYFIENVATEVTAQAAAHGFALPAFSWEINGQPLTVHAQQETANIKMTITDTTPADDAPFDTVLPISYFISDAQNTSSLKIVNQSFPGNGDITITVQATERLVASDSPTSAKDNIPLQMRSYDMSAAWEADAYTCNSHAVVVMAEAVAAIANEVLVLLNSPDPSPEPIFRIAGAAQRYVRALESATKGSVGLRNSLTGVANLARGTLDAPATIDQPALPGGLPTRVRNLPASESVELRYRRKTAAWSCTGGK